MEAGNDHDSGGTMTRMRDSNQSRAYAARKASQAVDKLVTATSDAERAQAQVWTQLWGALAGHSQAKPSNNR
jgi:hypothetical protein